MSNEPPRPAPFEITRWSLITRAKEENSGVKRRALGELCAVYWYPLYVFLRCNGRSVEDSEDLVQDFLARLADGPMLAGAAPSNGKFRSLLLASLKNLESNTRRIAQALKRGGGVEKIPLDIAMAEQAWQADPQQDSPDRTFDRAWARTVIAEAAAALQAEYAASGKTALFAALFPRLNGVRAAETLAEVGSIHGMTEAAMKMAYSRMKARYAAALRAQISQTVGSQQDAEEEFRHLLTVLN